jgi:hypothetical protein
MREYMKREQAGFPEDLLDLRRCQELITEAIMHLPHVTLVIDAMDECDLNSRHRLLSTIRGICAVCPENVSVFLSSRNDHDIVLELEGFPNHYIQPQDNADDIAKYVDFRLQEAIAQRRLLRGNASAKLISVIAKELTAKANGMYARTTWISFYRSG